MTTKTAPPACQVTETTRKPKDWRKFVAPKNAAALLRKLAKAVATAPTDARVHFRVKLRIFREKSEA